MKIQISKKVGETEFTFDVEEEEKIDSLFEAGFLASMPTVCKCGSERVRLTGNKAKGYTFVKVTCEKCHMNSAVGHYKDGGFFWKDWEAYESNRPAPDSVKHEAEAPPENTDNIPF